MDQNSWEKGIWGGGGIVKYSSKKREKDVEGTERGGSWRKTRGKKSKFAQWGKVYMYFRNVNNSDHKKEQVTMNKYS